MKRELVPKSLLDDLKTYSPMMVEATKAILDEGVTKYPIFVAVLDHFKAGVPLINGNDHQKTWNINASSLEEFYAKKIMNKEAVDNFRKVYKDPKRYFCVFLVEDDDAKMLFIPIDKQFIHQESGK
ncbi:MAG TPA: hypothetical protein ENK85_03695 [Saprospiraceae bacterium]|nr:hypothetical protein [Saprospiraceae bacterium]